MVHDSSDVPEGPVNLDSVRVQFDEQRLISDAWDRSSTATLADRLGIERAGERVGVALTPGRRGRRFRAARSRRWCTGCSPARTASMT